MNQYKNLEKIDITKDEVNDIIDDYYTQETHSNFIEEIEQPAITHEMVEKTLFYMEEMLERCQLPFIVLGDVAVSIYNDTYFDNGILELGVLRGELTEGVLGTLESFFKDMKNTDDSIELMHEGVPVKLVKLHEGVRMYSNPDSVFYKITQFKVPNPFESYMESLT